MSDTKPLVARRPLKTDQASLSNSSKLRKNVGRSQERDQGSPLSLKQLILKLEKPDRRNNRTTQTLPQERHTLTSRPAYGAQSVRSKPDARRASKPDAEPVFPAIGLPLAFVEEPVRLNSMGGNRNRATIQTPIGMPYQPPRKTHTTQQAKRPKVVIRGGWAKDIKSDDANHAYFDQPVSNGESDFAKAYKTTRTNLKPTSDNTVISPSSLQALLSLETQRRI